MMKKLLTFVLAPVYLAACAGVPYEDRPRSLELTWNLTPEDFGPVTETIEQGELFFEWTAEAPATHAISVGSSSLPVAAVKTTLGTLYCTFEGANEGCYEDRDGNGKVDRKWNANRMGRAPGIITTANDPITLAKELPVSAAGDLDAVIATQMLGLIYDGPMRAKVEETGSLSSFVSSALVGWHGGKNAPRDPSGAGWVSKNVIVFLLVEDKKPETIIPELGFKYTPLQANVDGTMELTYSAIPVETTQIHKKLELDLKASEEGVEEPGV